MKFPSINPRVAVLTGSAIADRGLLGIATFVATVLLGRWAGPAELGLFSFFFPLVFVAIALEESLITAPYTVLAASHDREERRNYLGSVLTHSIILSATLAVFFCTAAVVVRAFGLTDFAAVTAILALVTPCVLLREFARRVVYADLRPTAAVLLSGGVSAMQLGLMAAFHAAGVLTAITAFIAMAVSSAVGGMTWLYLNRAAVQLPARNLHSAFQRNLRLGRWIAASQVGEVVRIHMFSWLLVIVIDETSAGVYAACAAVAALTVPIQIALSNLLLPQFASAANNEGVAAADRLVRQATIWITGAMLTLAIALLTVSQFVVPLIYGPAYVGTQLPLVLLILAQLAAAASLPAARALVAFRRTDLDFVCHLGGVVTNIAVGAPLVIWWGIPGAASAALLSAAVKAALCAYFYQREARARMAAANRILEAAASGVHRFDALSRTAGALRSPAPLLAAGAERWTEELP